VEAGAASRVGGAEQGVSAGSDQGLGDAGVAQGGRLVQARRPAAWRWGVEHLLSGTVAEEGLTYFNMPAVYGDVEGGQALAI
jgi:hypothetical protein